MNNLCKLLLILLFAVAGDADAQAAGAQWGFPLPNNAGEIEAGRFRSPLDYENTLKFYSRLYRDDKEVEWIKVVNLPQVKAIHLENHKQKAGWEGANIYQLKGEVRIFVIKKEKGK